MVDGVVVGVDEELGGTDEVGGVDDVGGVSVPGGTVGSCIPGSGTKGNGGWSMVQTLSSFSATYASTVTQLGPGSSFDSAHTVAKM